MKVIIISNTCSDEMYRQLQDIKYSEKISPQQNYFMMLIEGLIKQQNIEIMCVTARSIAEDNTRVRQLPFSREVVSDKLMFYYTKVRASNKARNITNYFQTKRLLNKIVEKDKIEDYIVIIDPLSFDTTMASLAALRRCKKIALVTDIPMYISAIEKKKKNLGRMIKSDIKNKLFMNNIQRFDGYCFLTKSMNFINTLNKPYCVIEGMVPVSEEIPKRETVSSKRVVLYAGGLYDKFGIKNLVEAAKEIDDERFELHLYGEGDCIDYINETSLRYSYIKYMGVLGTDKIKQVEVNASALINPRPNEEEFTKFSFPSKTLEYMNSGRPVWTTRLSGIPNEYFDYINEIEDSSIEKLIISLQEILSLSEEELDSMGYKSRTFARTYKCAYSQAKKLLEFAYEF